MQCMAARGDAVRPAPQPYAAAYPDYGCPYAYGYPYDYYGYGYAPYGYGPSW